uniref:G-protein coupled receptors family 1 profile domain-containing protein n=1 Tax=Cyprinus carpio carpio TaxID=630221 RepID=A0A8C1FMD8_CYPCA
MSGHLFVTSSLSKLGFCSRTMIQNTPGKHSSHESNIMYVFFSLLSAWTVFLNLLVIISISHFKKLHTPTNLIILSLAVADMFVGLIVMPVDAIKLIETCGYFGDTFCDMFIIIMGLLISTSMCNLVLIAVDRYVALCHPLLYPQKITMTKTLISICLCWFFSSTYNIGYLVGGRYFEASQRSDECYGKCYLVISFSWIFNDLFFSFLLPCTLIITLYLRIFYVAHQQVKVLNHGGKRHKIGNRGEGHIKKG